MDASSAAVNLATISTADPEWKKAKMEFLRLYLYYGPLAMVEDYQHETLWPDGLILRTIFFVTATVRWMP